MALPEVPRKYYAKVIRWVDGDTVILFVDQGFRDWGEKEYRLVGVNTPERGQINYKEAKVYAEHLAPVGTLVVADTYKDKEKWGRWLCDLYVDDIDVDEALIAAGLGKEYFGGKRV
jgi:micrococcal nuclease